jgi:dipeptidyl-peptidase-4
MTFRKICVFIPVVFSCFFITNNLVAQNVTLESVWKNYEYVPKSAGGWKWMKDGKSYAEITNNYSIVKYDAATGKALDTLLHSSDLTPKDSSKSIKVVSFEISSDEKKILLATEMESIYRHSTMEKNFIYFKDSKKLEALSSKGKQRYAQFSPDGMKVAYIINNNMYYADLLADEITEVQITKDGEKNKIIYGATDWVYEEEFGINRAFYWSPDSKKILYYRFDETNVKEYSLDYFEKNDYPRNEKYKYPKAGEDNSVVGLEVFNLEKQKQISNYQPTENAQLYYLPCVGWINESTIWVEKLNRLQNNLSMMQINVNDASQKNMLTETNKAYVDVEAKKDCPIFINDGKQFIWMSEQDGFEQLYLYNVDGKLVKKLSTSNFDVTDVYGYDEKTQTIYYQQVGDKPYYKVLSRCNINGNEERDCFKTSSGWASYEFSPTFDFTIQNTSHINIPPTYTLLDNQNKTFRVLEDNADLKKKLSDKKLQPTDFYSFKTEDGTELFGYKILPLLKSKKDKSPVFMYCYGGPNSAQVEDHWGGLNFMYFQFLAQNGYAMACVDNRGTGNRGEAFRKCTYQNLGTIETQDQISAARYLKQQNWVDSNKISMFGWSYGGFMATNCMLRGGSVFNACVAVAPVTDWRYYDNIYTERYMRTPKENAMGYANNNCSKFAENMLGNFLLMHGGADDNVHIQNTFELTNALIKADKQFDEFIFPNKAHGISGGNTRYFLFKKMTNFIFDKNPSKNIQKGSKLNKS